MINPSDLKIPPPNPYAFKSALKRKLMACLDGVGNLLLAPKRRPIEWEKVKRIAVLRLDHLGDLLMTLPALEALRKALPQAQIDLIVGPWGKEAAELARIADRVLVFEAPWFARPRKSGLADAFMKLTRLLQEGKYDCVIDFRGDFRHHFAASEAEIPIRAGQNLTGGGFLLTHPVVCNPNLHEVEQNLSLLQQIGITAQPDHPWASLSTRPENDREVEDILASLGVTKPLIVFHPLPGTAAKAWFDDRWAKVAEGLPEKYDVVAIGSEIQRPYLEAIQKQCVKKITVATGLSMSALGALFQKCVLYIGVDSGPAHIAAAAGTPVISLFSGTNRVEQWGPRGPKVTPIQKKTECSPCELATCPFDNECMRQITVDEVLAAVQGMLGSISN